jgi:hypothetical protein
MRTAVADPKVAIDPGDTLCVSKPQHAPRRGVQMRCAVRIAHY